MSWSHEEVRVDVRSWGDVDLLVRFTRDGTGDLAYRTLRFDNSAQLEADKDSKIAQIKDTLELAWSRLNQFDLGEDCREVIRRAIVQIRNSPGVTLATAESWYNTNFPNSLWRFDQLIARARDFLRRELGYVPTWDQFKTYVINNQFEGVDG